MKDFGRTITFYEYRCPRFLNYKLANLLRVGFSANREATQGQKQALYRALPDRGMGR